MNPAVRVTGRLRGFPTRDRQFVFDFDEKMPECSCDVPRLLKTQADQTRESLRRRKDEPAQPGEFPDESLVLSGLSFAAGWVLMRGIVRRMIDDDPPQMACALRIASRINYVKNLFRTPDYSGGSDCGHLRDVLLSLAANDVPCVEAYTRVFSSDAKKAHPLGRLYWNSIRRSLSNEDASGLIDDVMRRSAGVYDRAMLQCLAAIIEGRSDECFVQLGSMLKGFRRTANAECLGKLFATDVHALFHLACYSSESTVETSPGMLFDSIYWDEEVKSLLMKTNDGAELGVIEALSPAVADYAMNLPTTCCTLPQELVHP